MICDFWDVLDGSDSLGAVALDFDGAIIRSNTAFSRIVSREKADLVGMSLFDITSQYHRQTTREKIKGMRDGSRDRIFLVEQYLRPNGVPVWCQVEALVLLRPDSTERHCIVLFAWQLADSQTGRSVNTEIDLHMQILQEFMQVTSQHFKQKDQPGVQINMGRSDFTQVADRGGKNVSSSNNSTVLIALFICAAVVACAGMALFAGGYFRVGYGDSTVSVQSTGHPNP